MEKLSKILAQKWKDTKIFISDLINPQLWTQSHRICITGLLLCSTAVFISEFRKWRHYRSFKSKTVMPKSLFNIDGINKNRKVKVSTGKVPLSYHVYNSDALVIYGTVATPALKSYLRSLKQTHFSPLQQSLSNRSPFWIWVSNFIDSNHGSHNELNFSTVGVVSNDLQTDDSVTNYESISLYSEALLNYSKKGTNVVTTPCAIWNDLASVVSYNSEFLRLPAKICADSDAFTVDRNANIFRLSFDNIIDASIHRQKRSSLRAIWDVCNVIGLKSMFEVMKADYHSAKVLNLDGYKANCYIKCDNPALYPFDSTKGDRLKITHKQLSVLDFQPKCVESLEASQFVYEPPSHVS